MPARWPDLPEPLKDAVRTLQEWARRLKRDIAAVALAARDPRVPWYVKALALFVVAYALSPIDLIPDFIPVLGYLDDIILVPLGLMLVVHLLPPGLLAEYRARAQAMGKLPRNRLAGAVILGLWLLALGFTAVWAWNLYGR